MYTGLDIKILDFSYELIGEEHSLEALRMDYFYEFTLLDGYGNLIHQDMNVQAEQTSKLLEAAQVYVEQKRLLEERLGSTIENIYNKPSHASEHLKTIKDLSLILVGLGILGIYLDNQSDNLMSLWLKGDVAVGLATYLYAVYVDRLIKRESYAVFHWAQDQLIDEISLEQKVAARFENNEKD